MAFENFKYPMLAKYFEEISGIPRKSYHEEKIAKYLVDFAKVRGLEYYTDSAHNVLINLPASKGLEMEEALLLQGHTDMVCEKNTGVEHDFLNEGLKLYAEDGFLKAEGTTLGADDGLAVASMLAILDGAIDKHPPIQCLFTAAEEVGLDGAKAFDYSRIYADKMINMDSAEEKYLIVGCAGGVRSDVNLALTREPICDKKVYKISLGGLMGGHSGENIGCGRANANILAASLLKTLFSECSVRLIAFDGGTKDNAIPREAILLIAADNEEKLIEEVKLFEKNTKSELCQDDENFFTVCEQVCDSLHSAFSNSDTEKVFSFVESLKNGVLKMSDKIEGLVEFSRNLGIVKTDENGIDFYFTSRSALEEELDASVEEISGSALIFSGEVRHYNRYPGWEVGEYSPLAEGYIKTAFELFGLNIERLALHAGLECGIIKQALPHMDIISCGPDVFDLHSPEERMNISSFERFFEIVCKTIERLGK